MIRATAGLHPTGRTWSRDGLSGPVMVDDQSNEHEAVSGSVADITNGRLDRVLDPLVERLLDRLGAEAEEA